jgi:hypothetical protein
LDIIETPLFDEGDDMLVEAACNQGGEIWAGLTVELPEVSTTPSLTTSEPITILTATSSNSSTATNETLDIDTSIITTIFSITSVAVIVLILYRRKIH